MGRSELKWTVFLAIYKGKKRRKTADEIAEATGLTRSQVLNAAKPMARAGLFRQESRDPVVYIKIDEITYIRDRVVSRRKTSQKVNTKKKEPGARSDMMRKRRSRRTSRTSQYSEVQQGKSTFDVFISHASEDKEPFVRGLAERIRSEGITVWYDEFSLRWGDRLRASIDEGLRRSKFGIVVLSPDFFKKDWPKDELEGLFALEENGRTMILPIWHNISKADLANFSPMLVGRLAVNSNEPIEQIIEKLRARLES